MFANRLPPPRFLWFFLLLVNLGLLAGLYWMITNQARKAQSLVDGLPAVVARVDGRPIYAVDLLSAARLTSRFPSGEQLRDTLQRLVVAEIVAQKARQTPVSTDEIARFLITLGHQFSEPDSQRTALFTAGLTEDDLRQRATRHLQTEKWLRQAAASTPTDEEVRAWFDTHPEMADLPGVVQATHFAAIPPPRRTEQDWAEKRALVRDVQMRLAEGMSLTELIENFSDDPARKATGGSLAWFRRERMEPALAEAAFSQRPGVLGEPLETRFGVHLLLVNDWRASRTLPFAEMTDEARLRCRDEQERKKIQSIVTTLRQRAKVEVFDSRLQFSIL